MNYSYVAKIKAIDSKRINFTKIRINSEEESFEVGDTVEAQVTFFEYDNKEGFYAENIYMGSDLKRIISVKQNKTGIRYKIFRLQEYVKETVSDYLDGDIGQLIVAAITGDRSGLSDETYGLIKNSGVAHMIVVSGMHLSIVCTALMWIFSKTISNRYIQTFAMLTAIFFIMFFCGFTKSILRAGITYIILALAPLLKRDRDSLSALAFTVILVMLMSPFAFYSISFQLTLSSTFGILVLSPIISRNINNLLHTQNVKVIKNFIDIISVTIAANIMTLPIVLYVYEWVSAVSLLTNILINYTVSAMLIIGIIGAITGKITVISYPCFFFAGLLSKYSLWVIKWLGSMPLATVSFNGKPLAAIVCMIYLVILVLSS
jgi:competence protein ComEC